MKLCGIKAIRAIVGQKYVALNKAVVEVRAKQQGSVLCYFENTGKLAWISGSTTLYVPVSDKGERIPLAEDQTPDKIQANGFVGEGERLELTRAQFKVEQATDDMVIATFAGYTVLLPPIFAVSPGDVIEMTVYQGNRLSMYHRKIVDAVLNDRPVSEVAKEMGLPYRMVYAKIKSLRQAIAKSGLRAEEFLRKRGVEL